MIQLLKCKTPLLANNTALNRGNRHSASFFATFATLTCCAPMFTCTAFGLLFLVQHRHQ
jgi:hypothetical protein